MRRINALYLIGLSTLGIAVTFILQANLGAGAWDALGANLRDGFQSTFRIVQSVIVIVLLPTAMLLQKKKIHLYTFIPISILVILAIAPIGTFTSTLIDSIANERNLQTELSLAFETGYELYMLFLTALVIPLFYYLKKKGQPISIYIPILISFYVGLWIDIFINIIPSVDILWLQLLYLFTSINLIGIALNFIIYPNYPIPAIDEFTKGISVITKLPFGRTKMITEAFAVVCSLLAGFAFSLEDYRISYGTIIVALGIGISIDLYKPLVYKVFYSKTKD